MKKMRIIVTLFVMMLAVSGCSGESEDAAVPPDKEVSTPAGENRPAVSETGNIPPENAEKPSADTPILTVNGTPVKWPEFHFWLNYIAKYYKSTLGIEKITDWEARQNGMELRDFFLSTAVGYACKDRAIEAKAMELDIDLTEDDIAEIEEKRASNIRIYGSELEYRRIVSSMYMSEEVFNYLTRIDYLGNYLFEHFYGASGEKFSDRDVSAYLEESRLICAKYIFRSNQDPRKETENNHLLKELLGRLDASDNPLPLFTQLMTEYNEDAGVSRYPQGRLLAPGGKSETFETACRELKENEYSGIVSDDEGCYIILRMPISPDMSADISGNTLRYRAAYELFKKRVEGWSGEMKVEYRNAYYHIDVEALL